MTKIEIAIVIWCVCNLVWIITFSCTRKKELFITIYDLLSFLSLVVISPISVLLVFHSIFGYEILEFLTKERSWRKSE